MNQQKSGPFPKHPSHRTGRPGVCVLPSQMGKQARQFCDHMGTSSVGEAKA